MCVQVCDFYSQTTIGRKLCYLLLFQDNYNEYEKLTHPVKCSRQCFHSIKDLHTFKTTQQIKFKNKTFLYV